MPKSFEERKNEASASIKQLIYQDRSLEPKDRIFLFDAGAVLEQFIKTDKELDKFLNDLIGIGNAHPNIKRSFKALLDNKSSATSTPNESLQDKVYNSLEEVKNLAGAKFDKGQKFEGHEPLSVVQAALAIIHACLGKSNKQIIKVLTEVAHDKSIPQIIHKTLANVVREHLKTVKETTRPTASTPQLQKSQDNSKKIHTQKEVQERPLPPTPSERKKF